MSVALGRRLGLTSTWRVMQVLGELSAFSKPTVGDPATAQTTHRLGRGQFLKGVGGAAVAMTILSSAKTSTSPALANNGNSESISFAADGMTKVTGKEAIRLVNRVKEHRDTSRLLRHFASRKSRLLGSGTLVFKVEKGVISGNARYAVSVPVVEGTSDVPVGTVVGYEYPNDTIEVSMDVFQVSTNKEQLAKSARESVTATALWVANGAVKQESATRTLDSPEPAPQSVDSPGEITTQSFCSYLRCSKYRAGYVKSGCFFFCSLGCTPAKLNGTTRVACLVGCRVACWVPRHCVKWRRVLGPC